MASILSAKSDYIFKLLFGDERNIVCLRSFLASVLKVAEESINVIHIVDPFLQKESADDKLGVLDVKVDLGSRIVDIEIQLHVSPGLRKRLCYYLSNMICEQIGKGGKYDVLRPVIIILIVEAPFLQETKKPHSTFEMCDNSEHFMFSDLMRIDVLELSKLPATVTPEMTSAPESPEGKLLNWMRFIKSEDEEEMEMLARTDTSINHAYGVLKELSQDEIMRRFNASRLKWLRDQEMFVSDAMNMGIEKGLEQGIEQGFLRSQKESAKRLLHDNLSVDKIANYIGLPVREVLRIKEELDAANVAQ